TNLSEWANIRSGRSTSGWSGRGGQTKNPYVLNRNPSGSSSGSGAATSDRNELEGVGQYPLGPFHQRLERAGRTDKESLRAESQPIGIQLRFGRRHVRSERT